MNEESKVVLEELLEHLQETYAKIDEYYEGIKFGEFMKLVKDIEKIQNTTRVHQELSKFKEIMSTLHVGM